MEEDAGDREDASMPDAGPMEDSGPDADSGPDTGPPIVCDFDGSYSVNPDPENPAFCTMLGLTTRCSFITADGTTSFTCGGISGECTYDTDCVCTGMVSVLDTSVTIAADFSAMSINVNAGGAGSCAFTLVAFADS